MIKLIASDIDGTLVNSNKEFSPDFENILKELEKRDIKFVAASGRSKYSLQKIFNRFNSNIFYISDNGAYVSDNKKDYGLYTMKREEVFSVLELLLPIKGIQIVLCGKEKAYFINFKKEFLENVKFYYNEYEVKNSFSEINDDILKIAVYDSLGSAVNTNPKIENKLPKDLCSVVSSDVWLDIMDKKVTKGLGIKTLQKNFNIKEEETMAFGDYFNDVEMLKCAKYSYAMENSSDEIKKSCNFVAPSNDKFGVSEVIKKEVLK